MADGTAHDGRIARARVRAESGRWLVVRASALGDDPGAQVAVMIEPARPHELAPLLADAYRLTEREREVTRLVARGLSTEAIGARLYLTRVPAAPRKGPDGGVVDRAGSSYSGGPGWWARGRRVARPRGSGSSARCAAN